jgi:hypothetical protein
MSSIQRSLPPPPQEGPQQAQLEPALDHLYDTREQFRGVYEVLSFMARRRGGQGMVQFMRRTSDGLQFAVKFFDDRKGADMQFLLFLS